MVAWYSKFDMSISPMGLAAGSRATCTECGLCSMAAAQETPRASAGRRRLALEARQTFVDTGPARRARGPYRGDRPRQFRIVECADAHDDEMRPRLRFAEQLHAT